MLLRFDPFRELDRLSDEALGSRQRSTVVPLDAYREGDRFFVRVDLPGVDPSSIDLQVEKNVLTLRAERPFTGVDGQEWVVAERAHGTFTRQLFLGDTLDASGITARYEHGVLFLEIPVAERAKPRKIEVAVEGAGAAGEQRSMGAASPATEVTSTDTTPAGADKRLAGASA
jgi:HSP20 family protein